MKINIPFMLIGLRLVFGILNLFLALTWKEKAIIPISILIVVGLLTDIFDGIIARKTNSSSVLLRRLDSQVDMVFWVLSGVCVWIIHPTIIETNLAAIYLLIAMEIACYVTSLLKFKKETCTHALLSKIWGLTLCAAIIGLLINQNQLLLDICIVMGVISHLDRIFITLLLPHWTHDVPSTYHAYLIRQGKSFKKNDLLNS